MTTKNAIDRLRWRLVDKSWKANQTDFDAFNKLVDYVNLKDSEQIYRQELTFKLYIIAFEHQLTQLKGSVFDPIPQKEFHKTIDMPLDHIVEGFRKNLNNREQFKLLDKNGVEFTHPLLVSEGQDKKDAESLNKMLKNEGNAKKLFGGYYDFKTVYNELSNQFNEFINFYNNARTY